MMKALAIALLAAAPIAGCQGEKFTPITPTMGICEGSMILPSPDSTTGCDMRRPNTISYFMDDPGPIQEEECRRSGGTPLFHTATAREICSDIDY